MTSPPPSPPSSPSSRRYTNRGTMVPGVEFLAAWQAKVARQVISPQDAYEVAVAADRTRDRMTEVGYRLYWMNDQMLGSQDVVAQPGGYAVVGRHGSCDVVIEDERLVSLRHVLVRAASLDDGFPVISLLDLQTSTGFDLSDGSRQRSVAATGPVVFRIGVHSLVALPSSGRYDEALPVPVVERGELAPHRIAAERIAVAAPVHDPRAPRASRITVLPGSVDFSRRTSSVIPEMQLSPDYVPTGEGYLVIVEGGGKRAGVRLSNLDLEHGVLLGRADKCVDEGLRSILSDTVSRVHVLLIREKGACYLYDTGSQNGTKHEGEKVRCLALEDSGTTVRLAGHTGVTLYFRGL